MFLSSSIKILVGISSNPVESKGLIYWVVKVLASRNDSIVAIHCLEDKKRKKRKPAIENQSRLRRAKAYVISVLGEFVRASHSKQSENRASNVTVYCFENPPPCCTPVLVGKNGQLRQSPDLDSPPSKDNKLSVVQRREQAWSRTVFDEHELGSTSTVDDTDSPEDSSLIESPPLAW